mgnify:CR=1 FL=1
MDIYNCQDNAKHSCNQGGESKYFHGEKAQGKERKEILFPNKSRAKYKSKSRKDTAYHRQTGKQPLGYNVKDSCSSPADAQHDGKNNRDTYYELCQERINRAVHGDTLKVKCLRIPVGLTVPVAVYHSSRIVHKCTKNTKRSCQKNRGCRVQADVNAIGMATQAASESSAGMLAPTAAIDMYIILIVAPIIVPVTTSPKTSPNSTPFKQVH